MKKLFFVFIALICSVEAFANQPKNWQLGFQDAASQSMRDIVNFHNNLLLPIIIAISIFVLFLILSNINVVEIYSKLKGGSCLIKIYFVRDKSNFDFFKIL